VPWLNVVFLLLSDPRHVKFRRWGITQKKEYNITMFYYIALTYPSFQVEEMGGACGTYGGGEVCTGF
jgi:hypothetical protein